jgi:hypothetical protein
MGLAGASARIRGSAGWEETVLAILRNGQEGQALVPVFESFWRFGNFLPNFLPT